LLSDNALERTGKQRGTRVAARIASALTRIAITLCTAASTLTATAQVSPDIFIQQSLSGLEVQQAANDATWGMRHASKWDIDQDKGKIVFSFADGRTATASVQIVGTFNPKDNTFLWGWDHPAVNPKLRRAAAATRDWARKNKLERWAVRKVSCTEAEAWEFTAVAARLDGAAGAYRAPAGGPLAFVVFGEVTLSKKARRSGS
jgi:hypothetical protein